MANAAVGGREEKRARRYIGEWHIHDRPGVTAHGELAFDGGSGILELAGALTGHDDDPGAKLIFGVTDDGIRLTLTLAWRRNHTINSRRDSEHAAERESWGCVAVYEGEWLPKGKDTKYVRADLSTRRLDDWAGIRPEPSLGPVGGVSSITVEIPTSRSAEVHSFGSISLHWGERSTRGEFEATIEAPPSLSARFDVPLTSEEVWQRFVLPSVHWLILATGRRDEVVELRLWPDLPKRNMQHPYFDPSVVSLAHSWRTSDATPNKRVSRREQPIPLLHKTMQFERVIPLWFALHFKFRTAFIRFFAQVTDPAQFADESFERIVRSMEVWSGEDDPSGAIPAHEFDELLRGIQERAPQAWEFFGPRLEFANRQTLKRRLDRMLDEAGEPLTTVTKRWKGFVRRTVETRNSLIHRGDVGNAFSNLEMFMSERVWQLVLFAILMRRLGATTAEVTEMLGKTEQWDFLDHRLVE